MCLPKTGQAQQDHLAKEVMHLQKKLQEEMLQRGAVREETQNTLETFRQDVDNISLVCFDLEHEVDSLGEEVDFLGKLCSDKSCELQAQPQCSMGKLGYMVPSQNSQLSVGGEENERTFGRLRKGTSPSVISL